MDITIRAAQSDDAEAGGRLIYEGFRALGERHGYPPPVPSIGVATARVAAFIRHPSIYALAAEADDGRVVGVNFLHELDSIVGVGPIVVDPAVQSSGIGRRLMEAVLVRGRGAPGIRLLQDSFNVKSLSLYASLGFDARQSYVVLGGRPDPAAAANCEIRPLGEDDVAACEALYRRVAGHTRTRELREALAAGLPVGAFKDGRLTAYMTAPTRWVASHAVAESDDDMRALIAGAARLTEEPLSFLAPIRKAELLRWCLAQGLRAMRPMTLMTIGEYREPDGVYFPSVNY